MTYLPKQNASLKENTSKLVSLDILQLLKRVDSVVLNCAGKGLMKGFEKSQYMQGEEVFFQVPGVPPITRGVRMDFDTQYEQKSLSMRADKDRWQFSATNTFDQTDTLFYMNRKLWTETVVAPIVAGIKDKIEMEGIQYLKEHSPIIPTYGESTTEPLKPTDQFNWDAINYLNKLRKDLIFSPAYKLLLNTRDDMSLASNTTRIASADGLVTSAIKSGEPTRNMSGFQNLCSPYIGLHETLLTDTQRSKPNGYGVFFSEVPTIGNNNRGVLRFYKGITSHDSIKLRAGDLIYQTAGKGNTTFTVKDSSLNWIQNTVKQPILDTRYSFCITSDAYIDRFREIVKGGVTINPETGNVFKWRDFKYENVRYRIPTSESKAYIFLGYTDPANKTGENWDATSTKISFSHDVVPSGYHQNISRAIVLDSETGSAKLQPAGTPDRFLVYGSHYKNFGVNKSYFQFHCFKLDHLHGTEHEEVSDSRTGIKMLITKDRMLESRQNIFDVTALPCFGAIGQNLFTLPTAPTQSVEGVTLVGKKKI